MKSVMQHKFSQIPSIKIPRSVFDRSHGFKTTFNSGYLVPFFLDEGLPGDTFNLHATHFARLATPIKPFMDNLFLETFYFAVPYRLVWDNWQKFNGEQENPGDSTDFLIPQISSATNPVDGKWHHEELADYFGLPTGITNVKSSSLPFRAYNKIWNEWFRDENLQDSVPVNKESDGDDDATDYNLLHRGKRHDYFTSCLPWPQKGPGVDIPLSGGAPVYGTGYVPLMTNDYDTIPTEDPYTNETMFGTQVSTNLTNTNVMELSDQQAGNHVGITEGSEVNITDTEGVGFASKKQALYMGSSLTHPSDASGLWADLSGGPANATINELRQAFQIQRMQERDARGGTRYTEIIRSHFGVISPDARLQRSEFLGGGSQRININPVQQTSNSTFDTGTGALTNTPQGNLAAYGTVSDSSGGFSKSFTEHVIIIGLINVRADITYQQGLNRMWSRRTREDFYWPALAHIGEQPVYTKEIYCLDPAAVDEEGNIINEKVFGYQERYAEYRYKPSQITGKFRSTDAQPLDSWHLAQYYTAEPKLEDSWIQDNPPIGRVIAVEDEPQFLLDSYIQLKCARPMPIYGVPGNIDHF